MRVGVSAERDSAGSRSFMTTSCPWQIRRHVASQAAGRWERRREGKDKERAEEGAHSSSGQRTQVCPCVCVSRWLTLSPVIIHTLIPPRMQSPMHSGTSSCS